MTNTEIANANKIMLGATEVSAMYIGNKLIWIKQQNQELPYDAELEYLQSSSDGGQYIDTNIFPNGNSYASADVLYLDITSVDNIGTVNINSDRFLLCCVYLSKFHFGCSDGWINTLDVDTQRHTFELSGLGAVKIDGTSYTIGEALTGNTTYSLYIFGKNGTPETKGTSKSFRIYSFKYYENNVLILDLIPVRIGQVGYMYDKISGLLFGNQGTGNFILGRDKLPNGYTKLEYISSTNGGNQYIDLGIKLYEVLNTDYDIAIKFVISSTNSEELATMFNCLDPNNSPWPGTFIRKNTSGSNITGRYIGGTQKDNTIGQLNNIVELPVLTSPSKNVTNINNNNTTHQYGTSLFCSFSDTNNTPQRYCNGTIYYFKLFVNGTLVRDIIPCKNSNNIVGLYDLVNRVFYSSPNGNAFVAGPEIN